MVRPRRSTSPLSVAPRLREFAVFTAMLVTLSMLAKSGLSTMLPPAGSVDLRFVELRVSYNARVAFSIGNQLPSWLIVGQILPQTSRILAVFLTLVTAGAVANLADRIPDGVVTDYLYTVWVPTFNLAACFITLGAVGAVVALLHESRTSDHGMRGVEL